MSLKIVAISDTHRYYFKDLPEGDVLVHAGDWSSRGSNTERDMFCDQLDAYLEKYPNVVVISGNHDWIAERDPQVTKEMIEATGAIYLNDSGCEINGYKFWGSPITPWFHSWAFNRHRGEAIQKHWVLIPNDTQILVTHGPPQGILDRVRASYSENRGERVGCSDLLAKIENLPDMKVHIFGHIHEGWGKEEHNGKIFVNASMLNENYEKVNKAIEIEI